MSKELLRKTLALYWQPSIRSSYKQCGYSRCNKYTQYYTDVNLKRNAPIIQVYSILWYIFVRNILQQSWRSWTPLQVVIAYRPTLDFQTKRLYPKRRIYALYMLRQRAELVLFLRILCEKNVHTDDFLVSHLFYVFK